MKTVKDVMSTLPVWVSETASFREIAARLRECRVSAFPVLDVHGKLTGVVSEADLLVKEAVPDAQFVFLAPPSWDEMVRRLVGRGTESAEEQQQRLETAKLELAAEPEFDHTVINDDVRRAADELVSLMGLTPNPR